jgi:hypothetical protein
METRSSETSVLIRPKRRHARENGFRHSSCRENLKSYIALTGWALKRRRNVFPMNWVFISQRTALFIVTAVKTSYLKCLQMLSNVLLYPNKICVIVRNMLLLFSCRTAVTCKFKGSFPSWIPSWTVCHSCDTRAASPGDVYWLTVASEEGYEGWAQVC